MKRRRWILANSPALAISTLALIFAVGGGAGYAASTSSSAQPVYHQLKLRPFWTGRAEYTVIDGVVYLSGVVNGHKRGDNGPLLLPRSIAPKGDLAIPAVVSGGDGSVAIDPAGDLLVIKPPHGNLGFVSLDGISFPIGAP